MLEYYICIYAQYILVIKTNYVRRKAEQLKQRRKSLKNRNEMK